MKPLLRFNKIIAIALVLTTLMVGAPGIAIYNGNNPVHYAELGETIFRMQRLSQTVHSEILVPGCKFGKRDNWPPAYWSSSP